MNLRLLLFCALLTQLQAATPVVAAPNTTQDVRRVLENVDQRYNRMQSLRVAFDQTYLGAGVDRRESGTLLLKRPGRMRWEYREPREKLFLSDGKTAYFYVPGERQARKAPVKKLDDVRSPLRFLLGKARLANELDGATFSLNDKPERSGDVVITGVPKHLADRVERVLLEVDPESRIVRLKITEVDGSETDFHFRDFEDNPKVSDDLFRFTPPPGVEVVDGALPE